MSPPALTATVAATTSRLPVDLKWLGLAGPTASGKTAAALAVARTRPVEIVSVDSALVFRGMDIGTAKPSASELAQVPHHLIDIRDPRDAYNAGAFVRDATRLIEEIRARGRLPLLVGGTMLYFNALIHGIDEMPTAEPAVRASIEADAARLGWPAMHDRLAQVDAPTAARLSPNDSQRIQRALEVWHASGKPLSSFHAGAKPPAQAAALISLEPHDRTWLHERIAQRFDAMLEAGFLDEVAALRARGDLTADLPSMRCVGYRQAWEALDGDWPMAELRERGVAATRQLAKRQITWLRSMPSRQVIEASAPDAIERVIGQVDRWIATGVVRGI
ncbi:tRNA (adenosine(37)-N6)-dimethylallyltransferase MiaA [Variovorax sp. J22R133]|uniref:tRNA (adenosine(37)-N6)-dimethylallyltransferase MiaA n=1 Tax=Variovorax brevis TaxID=3053503 RepID=UPI0025767E0C|nr:tRNA (adenosine(37)-N6)-dimethylallyltransferase MiaA [Variovorax sp. J22R133]MDM0113257.1 tRNA (adenosine(37)-N6)-dimethylallyltransferase MiaA [Variovorax sp. J22R133]